MDETMTKFRIGDKVQITSGYEAGRSGTVLRINPSGAVIVQVETWWATAISPRNLARI